MTLTIDGQPQPPLKPRIAAMVMLLVENQELIETLSSGCVELHYSSFQVTLNPPRARMTRKISQPPVKLGQG